VFGVGIYNKYSLRLTDDKRVKITRKSLLRNLFVLEALVLITIILIMNGPFVFIGIPLLLATVLFYISYMIHWKAFQYSPKLIHIITCLTILITILLSGVITNAIAGFLEFLLQIKLQYL
jgi:hypothetical protein